LRDFSGRITLSSVPSTKSSGGASPHDGFIPAREPERITSASMRRSWTRGSRRAMPVIAPIDAPV
jgi:hypothetical protein